MKNVITISILILILLVKISAQSLSPAASLLFKDVKSKLSISEKNYIAKLSNLTLSTDKKSFIIKEDPETNYSVEVYPLDLNNDGQEEVFIAQYSSWFGNSGEDFTIYIKNEGGIYQSAISVLGNPLILESVKGGYPDLVIGGPGFQFPVWQWNGKNYVGTKNISDAELQKLKTKSMEDASKEYTSGASKKINEVKPAETEVITQPQPAIASEEELTAQAASLFKNVKSKLSNAEKNLITRKSGLACGDTLISNGLGKTKVIAKPLPVDLNRDGKEEIFISVKTTALGITSTAFKFYSMDASGNYQAMPKDIIGSLKVIKAAGNNFPDLLAGIPGLDRELWKWNGRNYGFNMKVNGLAALAYKISGIEEESERYVATINIK